jgi:hypothetical protein
MRGRGLRDSLPSEPQWSLYLLGSPPPETAWPSRWVRWRDFWLPSDDRDARAAFEEAHRLALLGMRVEVVCGSGKGRTGTALACIAQFAGIPPQTATSWVRAHYRPGAVETPWQRRYVRRFRPLRS